jgi:hypothetical protein
MYTFILIWLLFDIYMLFSCLEHLVRFEILIEHYWWWNLHLYCIALYRRTMSTYQLYLHSLIFFSDTTSPTSLNPFTTIKLFFFYYCDILLHSLIFFTKIRFWNQIFCWLRTFCWLSIVFIKCVESKYQIGV